MKKSFEGQLFNRMELLGNRKFNHVGCQGESSEFINFLTKFVPEVGMKRNVKFTVEAMDKPVVDEEYKKAKKY